MRWFLVFLIVLLSLGVGMYVLTVANVINPKAFLISKLENWDLTREHFKTYKLGLQEEAVFLEQEEQLKSLSMEIEAKRTEIALKEAELAKREKDLEVKQRNIDASLASLEKEKSSLQKVVSKNEALKTEALLLSEMEIEAMGPILDTYTIDKQVELLSFMDTDTIRDVLSRMEAKRAANLLSKVSEKIEGFN